MTKYVTIKKIIGYCLVPFKPIIVFLLEAEAWISKGWTASAHSRLFIAEWKIPKNPEFFDHHIDLFYLWRKSRSSYWVERGVYGSLAIKRGGVLLDLACGDGFFARNFYSVLTKTVIACDFEKKAISTAKRKNGAKNI